MHHLNLQEEAVFLQLLWKLPKNICLKYILFEEVLSALKYHSNTTSCNSTSIITLTLILPELPMWLIPLSGMSLSLKEKAEF